MHLGVHQLCLFDKWNDARLDYINRLRDWDCDCLDVVLRSIADYKMAGKIRKRADSLGLKLNGAGGSLPNSKLILACNPEERKNALQFMKDMVCMSSELGSSFYGGVIYASPGYITGKPVTAEEIGYSIDAIGELARFAQQYGVRIGLEIVNRYETYVLNTIEQAIDFINKVGEKNVGIFLDTYHMNIEEKNYLHPITLADDRLFHIHLNESDRGIPGTGNVKWEEVFQGLKAIDYRGTGAIETFPLDLSNTGILTYTWRNLFQKTEDIFEKGLHFLRNLEHKYGLD